MIDFLIKSTASLFVLLAVYHLALEKEKMHHFNRFYLLFSIVFSFALPFIIIEVIDESSSTVVQTTNTIITGNAAIVNVAETINYTPIILWSLYGIVTSLLFFRFVKNILKIRFQIKSHTIVDYKKAKLVLLKEETLPHTFWNYIFINESDYQNRKIEEELYTHELIHVTQKHTFDILLIETLKVMFWFNPIFIFYKRAMQLNHEFLADEEVVISYNNVSFYQNLLLSKANDKQTFYLASNLNYSVTKKRLIMMTKTSSQSKIALKKLALLPLFSGLIFFTCIESIAQEKNVPPKNASQTVKGITQPDNSIDKKRDAYYAGVRIIGKNKQDNTSINKMYEELTAKEKITYLEYVPKPFVEKEPSDKEYNDFKNSKKYAIWIDDKHVSNQILENYSPKDFVFFTGSSVFKNARSKRFPQPFQYWLYTQNYFDINLKNSHLKFSGDTIHVTIGNEHRKVPK